MNNPLRYTDPDGQNPVLIGAAIGAMIDIGVQLYSNGGHFSQIKWQQVAIAAVAGGVGGGIGKAIETSAKVAGVVTALTGEATRAFVRGAIIGAFSGAGSSLTTGVLQGQSGWALAKSVGISTLAGAVTGGLFGYGQYKYQQWRANAKQPIVLTEEPRINNPNGKSAPTTSNVTYWEEWGTAEGDVVTIHAKKYLLPDDEFFNSFGGTPSAFVPRKPSVLKHIFRDEPGHINPNTDASKERFLKLFENVASNPNNERLDAVISKLLAPDAAANSVKAYTQTFRAGQVWVFVRNGRISDAGINLIKNIR